MQEYDSFAPYYDSVMGDRTAEIVRLRQLIAAHMPQAGTLLELGCGTGSVIAGLSPLMEVSGLERSPAMLAIAQDKLPDSDLRLGDMTDFTFGRMFDVVICVFDTINHITTFEGWQKVFLGVRKHLNSGGIFIFDMITTGRIQAVSDLPYFEDDHNGRTVTMDIEGTAHNEIQWHINVETLEPDGIINVHEEHFREASFPLALVRANLAKIMKIESITNTNGSKASDRSGRVYFVCRIKND